jgi:hypothetical protein
MLRLPRSFATLATLLLASVTTVATAGAGTPDSTAKASTAKVVKTKSAADHDKKHPSKKKIVALLKSEKRGEKLKKLPPLPAPSTKVEPKKVETKKVDDKADEKANKAKKADDKAEKADKKADKNEPPPELTGSLPQAKLADKKLKKADEKAEKKAEEKAEKKAEEKAEKKSDKKADAKDEKAEKADKKSDAKKAKAAKDDDEKKRPEVSFGRAPKSGALAAKIKMKTCFHPTVSFSRMGQVSDATFPLTTCDGKPTTVAIESLSVLARPYDVPAPKLMPASNLSKSPKGQRAFATTKGELAPGVRRVDSGLVLRLQAVADRFPGKTITLVSGYRPASKGSLHASAQAFDIRVDGVTNETLVAFCKTMKDTGCGYYPNSFFVHVDVRPTGSGHVYWIDVSGPGEKPVYVKSWPPPLPAAPTALPGKADTKLDPLPEAKGEKQVATTTDEKTIEAVAEPMGDEH